MGIVYLLRHGQASFGADDYDVLSAMGTEQSIMAGRELARRSARITTAYHGTLFRQRDTAAAALGECMSEASETVTVTDPRLNEYDFADIVARHGNRAAAEHSEPRAFQRVLDAALLEWMAAGERSGCAQSWSGFRSDALAALDDVVRKLGKGEQALITTSGGVIATVCAELLGAPDESVPALNRVMVNAGITKVISGRGGTTLVSFNEHSHFEGEAAPLLSYR